MFYDHGVCVSFCTSINPPDTFQYKKCLIWLVIHYYSNFDEFSSLQQAKFLVVQSTLLD